LQKFAREDPKGHNNASKCSLSPIAVVAFVSSAQAHSYLQTLFMDAT